MDSLSVLQLPSACRILTTSCCPDKDLVVLISRLAGQDRLSLWKIHNGNKIWEAELDELGSENTTQDVPAIAWSPDGQTIAVAFNPPRISIRSIQDGKEERVLSVSTLPSARLTGLSWFRHEMEDRQSSIPDIFRRNSIITGSVHSVLKTLPLLDNHQEESHKNTATNLFAFQGSQTRFTPTSSIPVSIKSWPTLPSDPLLASLTVLEKTVDISGEQNEADDANKDSILATTDDQGVLFPYLDGTFPLGPIYCSQPVYMASLYKHPRSPMFFVHAGKAYEGKGQFTDITPTIIELPLLKDRRTRDFAQLSSTARELLWYVMRLIKDMRDAWFGTDTSTGARMLGSIWMKAMEERQRDHFSQGEQSAMLDLTILLTTGRASDALQDFLLSGEQMSERSIQKWDSTMTEALLKLRDYSEKRITPALQRLHLVLEEIKGWSQLLPDYAVFQLQHDAIVECTRMTQRGIIAASWLASVARKEHLQFKEFMNWLRWETVVANPANDNPPLPKHDILEVNNYLMSGLLSSTIDKWFMGPIPLFDPFTLSMPRVNAPLKEIMERAKKAAATPRFTTYPPIPTPKDHNLVERNLDNLVQQLGISCQRVFESGSKAVSRAAVTAVPPEPRSHSPVVVTFPNTTIRDRIITPDSKVEETLHYYSILSTAERKSHWCICRRTCSKANTSNTFEFILLQCEPTSGSESGELVEVLDIAFLDDQSLAIVWRESYDGSARAFIGLTAYHELPYRSITTHLSTREEFLYFACKQAEQGDPQFTIQPIGVPHYRRLHGCESGPASLAVNGTRKFAAVMDERGTTLECVDLEIQVDEDEEVMEEEGDTMGE